MIVMCTLTECNNFQCSLSVLIISGSNFSIVQSVAPQMLASTCCSYLLCFVCNNCIYCYGDLYKSAIQELNEDTEKNFSDSDDHDESEEMKYIINWSLV